MLQKYTFLVYLDDVYIFLKKKKRRCVYIYIFYYYLWKDGVYICTHNKYCQIFLPSQLGWTKIYILKSNWKKKKKRLIPHVLKWPQFELTNLHLQNAWHSLSYSQRSSLIICYNKSSQFTTIKYNWFSRKSCIYMASWPISNLFSSIN